MLVEDHASFRQAIAFILGREAGIEVVAEAGTFAEARRLLAERDIDVAILDLHLPDGDEKDLIGEIREANPGCSVLMFSMSPGVGEVAGADGVFAKDAPLDEVVGTIKRFGNG